MQIYDVLKKDHQEVKALLTELVSLPDDSKGASALVDKIRDGLIPHSRAEEAVFYNSLREVPEANGKAWHGYEEHLEAETILRSLQVASKTGMGWKPLAQKLKTALDHHVAEEEGEFFSLARRALSDTEATQMAAAFQKMKPEIKEQGLMGTTIDLIANMMPTRFTEAFKKGSKGRKAA